MVTSFEFLFHVLSVFEASMLITSSSLSMSDKLATLRFLIMDETFLMNEASSSLFFAIENLDELTFSSIMEMETVRGAWSEVSHQSG